MKRFVIENRHAHEYAIHIYMYGLFGVRVS